MIKRVLFVMMVMGQGVMMSGVTLGESALAESSHLQQEPRFVGVPERDWAAPERFKSRRDVTTYMTAAEMKLQVAALTGFAHPSFDQFADVLGRFDPVTGRRTVDKPSLLSVLFLKKIADTVAAAVIKREQFLEQDERVVFPFVDLMASPSQEMLTQFLGNLHQKWLGAAMGPKTLAVLTRQFRSVEAAKGTVSGYELVLSMMLQHGGLYYY